MTAPSIQFAPSMSAENIASSVHAFETSVGTGASFAEHLDHAVQSSVRPASRPETQPSEGSRTGSQVTKPTQASDAAPQASRTQARSTAPQTKQGQSTRAKTQSADPSPAHKDEQRQPVNARNKDSRSSDSSRNADGRQAGEKETPSNRKSPFAQAVAQSAASQSGASSTTQPGDASMPAALLALLQAAQSPVQAVAVQPEVSPSNDPNASQADSSSTDADSATPSNLFQSLNFSTSNAAYQASLTNFQTPVQPAAQSTSLNGTATASQPGTPASSTDSLPSPDETSAPSADSEAVSGNDQSAPPSGTLPRVNAPAAFTDPSGSTTPTPASASQSDAVASAVDALPSTNGQPAQTKPEASGKSSQVEAAEPTSFIKNLKSDAAQHEAAKPTLEQGLTGAKSGLEPAAPELQQAVTNVTVTNHASSPALSSQVSANDSQTVTVGQDSGSPAVSAAQGSASGWTDSSTGDLAGDDSSPQSSSASQGSNGSKSSGSGVEFLPSSAFNSDAVSGVAPVAVHAVASVTLQSNTGFDNASSKAPENVSQSFNSAAQEKAFAAWQSVSAQVGRVVNTATLNALQNGTEMRVQLRTDAFGSMDIRATLEGGKVGAAIGVESAEAHSALLSQLPALQQSLNEHQVQLDQISVVSSHGQSGMDFGTGSGKQNGDPTPSGGSAQQPWMPEQVSEPASAPVTEAWQPGTSRGRLSVQA